jgi:hypothetical protein
VIESNPMDTDNNRIRQYGLITKPKIDYVWEISEIILEGIR